MIKYRDFKFLFQKSPSYLIFWVTQKCNFQCQHCFNHQENNAGGNELSLPEIQKISLNLQHIKYLTMAGGEPFLRDDLLEIAKIFYKQNDLHILNIVTNGWYTDEILQFIPKVLQYCPTLHVMLNVSIEGTQEVHDHIRNKPESFSRGMNTLEQLVQLQQDLSTGSRLSVTSSGTFCSENQDSFLDITKYITTKINIPYFVNFIRGDNLPQINLKKVDIKKYLQTHKEVQHINNCRFSRKYPFRNVKLAISEMVSNIVYRSIKLQKMSWPCLAGKKGFVLTATGDILFCEVLDYQIGNVRTYDYQPLVMLKSLKTLSQIKKIKNDKCHCTWECFQSINIVFNARSYPKLLLTTLKIFLQNVFRK